MQEKLKSYEKLEKIGEGTYGTVYRAKHLPTNNIVAIKKIKNFSPDEGIPATSLREILILKSLSHPNLISLLDVIYIPNKLYLVFEYFPQNLSEFLKNNTLSEYQIKSFSHQLLSVLSYLHSKRIYHRDVKPQNILVCNSVLKLADLGLSRPIHYQTIDNESNHQQPLLTPKVASLFYRAPELLLNIDYDSRVDSWGAGCVICEMSTGNVLFKGTSEIEVLFKIFQVRGTPNKFSWPDIEISQDFSPEWPKWEKQEFQGEIGNLLEGLLQLCPDQRQTCKRALHSYYFDDLDYV